MTTTTLTHENQAVIINDNGDGHVWACLYVNVRNGIANGDITNLRWSGKTLAGARRWADKQFKN